MLISESAPSFRLSLRSALRLAALSLPLYCGGCGSQLYLMRGGASHQAVVGSFEGPAAEGDNSAVQAPGNSQHIMPVSYNQPLTLAAPLELSSADPLAQDTAALQELDEPSSPSGSLRGNTSAEETARPPAALTENSPAEPLDAPPSVDPEFASQPQSVDYFVEQALANHPKILAARQRVAAESHRIRQARSLADPTLSNTLWPFPENALQTAGGRMAHQMSLSQMVPWPEKLDAKAAIVYREVQMAQAQVASLEREIEEAVRLAYYEVWFADRSIRIVEEMRGLIEDLTRVAEARYRTGESQLDVLRAELEADRLDDRLIELHRQKEVAQADLAALVQQPVSLAPESLEQLEVDEFHGRLDTLLSELERCNPELQRLVAEIQRNRAAQRLACLQKYPDFQFGLHYGIVSDQNDVLSPVANGNDNISFTIGTTLPIWREKIAAGNREAAHRTGSSAHQLEAERDALQGRLRRLIAQADALQEQKRVYQERIIPRTEDTLRLAVADYRGKRTDFFSLIETYRELLMFEIQVARFDASLAGTVAQIERTLGCGN